MTEERALADFVRAYIDRAVNSRDPAAVDELVDPAYEGVRYTYFTAASLSGWGRSSGRGAPRASR